MAGDEKIYRSLILLGDFRNRPFFSHSKLGLLCCFVKVAIRAPLPLVREPTAHLEGII